MYMENLFIAEAAFSKQNMNERHLLWHYSHRSAGYREKRSHNAWQIHWAWKHISLKYIATNKGEFQSSV